MIGYFPEMLPGELLYSSLARFGRVMGLSGAKVRETLLGPRYMGAVALVPANVGYMVSRLPESAGYDSKRIVYDHTLCPYFTAFFDEHRRQEMLDYVVTGSPRGTRAWNTLRTITEQGKNTKALRYCPLCAEEDVETFGECYWHRAHQAPGVAVCHKHHIALWETDVRTDDLVSFVPLEPSHIHAKEILLPDGPQSLQVVEWLASASYALMTSGLELDPTSTKALLRGALGLSAAPESALSACIDFIGHYSAELLDFLGCRFDPMDRQNWFYRMLNHSARMHHPMRYLMAFHFLNLDLDTVLHAASIHEVAATASDPFGAPPWQCLNPACTKYGQPVIEDAHVKFTVDRWQGTFECPVCGQRYRRTSVHPEHARVLAYGQIWEDRVQKLLAQGNSCRAVAIMMGVSDGTIQKRAQNSGARRRVIDSDLRQAYRDKWLKAIESHPDLGTYRLSQLEPSTHTWLCRHDATWLRDHSPRQVDWARRDNEYLVEAQETVQAMLAGPPMRIGLYAVAKRTSHCDQIIKNLDRLPATKAYLHSVCESMEDYVLRRARPTILKYVEESTIPSRVQFLERAGLPRDWVTQQPAAVKRVIDAIAAGIREKRG